MNRIVAIIAFALAALLPSQAMAERPLAVFAQLPKMDDPSISPDGTRVLAFMAVDGEQTFVILPLDGQGESVLVNAGDLDILDLYWVNDDWLVIDAGFDGVVNWEYGQFDTYMSRLIAFRADGKEQHVLEPRSEELLGNGGDVIWIASDGSPDILVTYRTSVLRHEQGIWPKVQRVDVAKNRFSLEVAPIEGIQQYKERPWLLAPGRPRGILGRDGAVSR